MLSFKVMDVLSRCLGSSLMGNPVTSIHFAPTDANCTECAEDSNIFFSPLGESFVNLCRDGKEHQSTALTKMTLLC